MHNFLTFGGILYATLSLFFGAMHFFKVSGGAYTSHLSWVDAMEMGFAWPWYVMEYVGLVA